MSTNRVPYNYKTHNTSPQYFEVHCVNRHLNALYNSRQRPVSYTHLDVYKRQPVMSSIN